MTEELRKALEDAGALVFIMLRELHAHVPEDQRPMGWSDLSDDQARRARNAVHAVLLEWEARKAALASKPLPPTDDVLANEIERLAGLDGAAFPAQSSPSTDDVRARAFREAAAVARNWNPGRRDRVTEDGIADAIEALSAQSPLTEGEQRAVDHALRLQAEESAQSPPPPPSGEAEAVFETLDEKLRRRAKIGKHRLLALDAVPDQGVRDQVKAAILAIPVALDPAVWDHVAGLARDRTLAVVAEWLRYEDVCGHCSDMTVAADTLSPKADGGDHAK